LRIGPNQESAIRNPQSAICLVPGEFVRARVTGSTVYDLQARV
jgi:hypothetical protein